MSSSSIVPYGMTFTKYVLVLPQKTPWNQFLIIRRTLVQHKLKSRKKVCHHSPFIVLSCCIQPQLIQHWFFVIFTQRDREQSKKMPSNVHTKQKNIWPQSPFARAWRQWQQTFSISKCSLRKHNKKFPHFFKNKGLHWY